MEYIRIEETADELCYVYDFPYAHNDSEAVHWVTRMMDSSIADSTFLEICTWNGDSGNEKSHISLMAAPIDEFQLLKEVREMNPDTIMFRALLKGAVIVVSLNLQTYEVSVGMSKDHILGSPYIAKNLRLNI